MIYCLLVPDHQFDLVNGFVCNFFACFDDLLCLGETSQHVDTG